MRGAEFAQLSAFAAIAEHGSFVKAAAAAGVSTSTLSQTLRALEERLGVRLLNRTTRSVAPTDAGERLLAHIRPALAELGSAVEAVTAFRDRPAGTLRLNVASLAGRMVIAPILARFLAEYPAIALDITVDEGTIDIVGGRYDAGIRAGRWIERDMIAVRISAESRLVALAAPDYLARHPQPTIPQDLQHHNCIRFRSAGAVFRWEFEKAGERTEVSVEGSLITTDIDLMLGAALDGVGICYMLEGYVAPYLAEGRLVRLLEDWAPSYVGYHVFYPGRRQMPAPLKVFIDFLRDMAQPG